MKMKRQNPKGKRQKGIQDENTVTAPATKKRQDKQNGKTAVTPDQISKLKNLIERVNLLPHLPFWVEESPQKESAVKLLPTLDWKFFGMNDYALSGEMHNIVEKLPQELRDYIRLGDLEEIKFYFNYIEPESILQEIDATSFASVWGSFERLRAENRYFIYTNSSEGSDPRFTNVFLARRRLIELLAEQELLYALASEKPKENLLLYARLYRRIEEYDHQAGLRIDGNNRITYSVPTFFRTLRNIDATRIRKCPICVKIFWADDGRMKFCSQKCGTTSRVRMKRNRQKEQNEKWQIAYQEKYKLQRIRKAEAEEAAAKLPAQKKPSKKQKGK